MWNLDIRKAETRDIFWGIVTSLLYVLWLRNCYCDILGLKRQIPICIGNNITYEINCDCINMDSQYFNYINNYMFFTF